MFYRDIRTIADHRHRSAHGGASIYLSDAFPDKYRGRIFMANIHEHAVLTDILEPRGSGFIGHHGDDFALANNAQWIGFSTKLGPEGSLYVLDWHDADICGKEVMNKETGRVFRISPTDSKAKDFPGRYQDLNQMDSLALAKLQGVDSAWHARWARVILQERAAAGNMDPAATTWLRKQFQSDQPTNLRLRAMWALHVTNQLSLDELRRSLDDQDPHVRSWAIQMSCEDTSPPTELTGKFVQLAAEDPSPVVRLYLAAAVQRVDLETKWLVLERLTQHAEDTSDHNLPKMIWFGLEPLVTDGADRALEIAASSQIPIITRHVARRLADAEKFDPLIAKLNTLSRDHRLNMLLGIRDALEGRFDMKSPDGWAQLYPELRAAGGETAKVALQLSQQFGDSIAAKVMLATVRDSNATIADRRMALQGLTGRKRPELKAQLVSLLDDDALRSDAIRSVAAFDDVALAKTLLQRYPKLSEEEKLEVVHALSSRSEYGAELTEAIRRGDVPKRDVPAYVARLLRRVVGNRFVDVWGQIEELDTSTEASFAKYRALLTSDAISKADVSAGRALFNRTCSACHKLHGYGGNVGPDITRRQPLQLGVPAGEYFDTQCDHPRRLQDAYRPHR